MLILKIKAFKYLTAKGSNNLKQSFITKIKKINYINPQRNVRVPTVRFAH